jgi:membrane protein DedA with SNARE-associated domain
VSETPNQPEEIAPQRSRVKQWLVPVLAAVFVIAITVVIHLSFGRHPERIAALEQYVYWGAFLISLIGNATIILPGAVLVILAEIGIIIFPGAGILGPILVGLAGAAGAAIGEMTGYLAGCSGHALVERTGIYRRVEGWMKRWGSLAVFLMAVFPFIFDVVGIVAGVMRFPFWKFVLFCWLGRTLLYTVVILLAALGFKAILPYLG